jgi:hypothetical protein
VVLRGRSIPAFPTPLRRVIGQHWPWYRLPGPMAFPGPVSAMRGRPLFFWRLIGARWPRLACDHLAAANLPAARPVMLPVGGVARGISANRCCCFSPCATEARQEQAQRRCCSVTWMERNPLRRALGDRRPAAIKAPTHSDTITRLLSSGQYRRGIRIPSSCGRRDPGDTCKIVVACGLFAPERGHARHAASEFWQSVSATNHLRRIGRTCLYANY